MEYGSIEREIYVDASPEVVFEVVSRPEHLREWWPDDAALEPDAGRHGRARRSATATGRVGTWCRSRSSKSTPPRMFSFRWAYDPSDAADAGNSLLVTFELAPSGAGTTLRMTETGFREKGWEVAVLEAAVPGPRQGWDRFLPQLARVRRPLGVRRVSRSTVDDDLWSAIGDPTRRRMLDLLLADGPGTATSLSEQLPVTRQAVAKHLGVLDRVGLVHGTPAGRERRYRVDEAQLARAVAQLASVGASWDARLHRIKRIAEAIQRTRRRSHRRHDGEPCQTQAKPSTATPRLPPTSEEEAEMVDILHRVGVKGSSPDDVYAALTTLEGLAGWWAERHDRRRRRGRRRDRVPLRARRLRHGGRRAGAGQAGRSGRSSRARPSGSAPGELRAQPGRRLHGRAVRAPGWREPVEFMHHCSTKWATFLLSLKQLVETGTGAPDP